jgi:hypothetical protein
VGDAAPGEEHVPEDWSVGDVVAIPGRDDAVLVSWVGGSCDDRAIITVDATGDRYTVAVESQQAVGLGCDAAGHFRSIVLTLNEPTPADAFAMS